MYRPFVLKLEELVREMVEEQCQWSPSDFKEELIHTKLEKLAEQIFNDYKDKLDQ